jgi:hypothetical protein
LDVAEERVWCRKYKQTAVQLTNISELQNLKLLILIFVCVCSYDGAFITAHAVFALTSSDGKVAIGEK